MEWTFPLEKYEQTIQEMITARSVLEKEKENWLSKRNELDQEKATKLDEQFKTTFEQLGNFFISTHAVELQVVLQTLHSLVEQGAAARLLEDYELGPFNLAMLIKEIASITDTPTLDVTTEIVRLTIVAGANLNTQKAYVGNGGAIGLEWICLYLAGGVESGKWLTNPQQFNCCYIIFCWIIDSFSPPRTSYYFHPFNTYLKGLHGSPAEAELQEKPMLAMIYYGFSPFSKEDPYQDVSFVSRLATRHIDWIFLLFPFEETITKPYISVIQQHLTKETAATFLNAFTGNNKTRKHFKSFFSQRTHWLLRYIVASAPELIFGLVKRNEQEMLAPFLKHFKPALQTLRDDQGNTLLHQAVLSRGLVENTIRLLRNSGLSLQSLNKEGLTPLSLARKNNKTGLEKLLK